MKNQSVKTATTKNVKDFQKFAIKAKAQKEVKGGVIIEDAVVI